MSSTVRRCFLFSFLIALFLAGGKSLMAYPVSITINATFSTIPGDSDPLGLGSATPPTATITTTVDSSTPQASYPVTVILNVPAAGLANASESGTLTINTNGTITANFSNSEGSFSAVLVLAGETFPSPVPLAFGTANFSAPGSTVTYNLLGAMGTVGVTGTVAAVGLTASPSAGITASYQSGGPAPAAQQVTISSNDSSNPSIPYAATVVSTNGAPSGFVSLSSSGGTTPETEMVTFSTSLAAGTYTGNIQINSGSTGAPISIPITYTVTSGGGNPSNGFAASPSSLSFSYTSGGTAPAAQTIALTSTTSTQLSFSASSTAAWATVTTSSGTTPATLTVTVNPTNLPVGTSSGTINITSSSASLAIPISILVSSAGGGGTGSLQISPSMLTYQFYPPGSTTSTQTVSVTSTGSAQNFTVSVTNGSFLSINTSSATTPASVSVTASPAGLNPGVYTGSVVFTSSSGSVTLPVTLNYSQGVQGTTITVAPAALTFNYTAGGSLPPAQSVSVSANAPIHFMANNIGFYLPVTPNSATTNADVSVSLNPAGLGVGTYTYHLVIVPDSGTAVSIPVTVTVTGGGTPGGAVTAAPQSLTFAYPATSTSPATQTIALTASAATSFSASASVPWLTVTSTGSTTNATLTVTASPTNLSPGTYTGSIYVSVAGQTALTIPVTYNVTQAPAHDVTFAPTAVAFAYQLASAAPAAQVITITPATPGLSYTVTTTGSTWLSADITPDLTQATLSVNTANLVAGVYYGSLKVTGSGLTTSPLFVPVTLTVSAGPAFGVSPTALTFTAQPNGTAPAAQTIAVAGSTATPFTVTSDASWIAVAPSSGTTPGSVTITVTPGALGVGQYQANVTITSGGDTAQTITVPVSLVISSSPTIPAITAITDAITYLHQYGAPGAIIAVWGQGLGPTTPAPLTLANSTTVATSAGGTQVFADGIPCPILFSSSGQVNAVLPFALEGKTTTQVQLVYQGVASNMITLPIQPAVPGIFSADSTGQNGGAILNQDLSVNSASNPAAAGTIVAVFGGGAGATNPEGSDGLLVPLTMPFPAPVLAGTVTVAGQAATVDYYGDAPGLVSGVLQVNVTIPAGTPSGPQAIVLTVGTASSQPNLVVYMK